MNKNLGLNASKAFLKSTFATALLIVSSQVAAVEHITQITRMVTYATYANNDTRYHNQVNISVAEPVSECSAGFYLAPEDNVANPSLIAFLLSAFHSDTNVRFAADENQVTPGSKRFCRIINVTIIK